MNFKISMIFLRKKYIFCTKIYFFVYWPLFQSLEKLLHCKPTPKEKLPRQCQLESKGNKHLSININSVITKYGQKEASNIIKPEAVQYVDLRNLFISIKIRGKPKKYNIKK